MYDDVIRTGDGLTDSFLIYLDNDKNEPGVEQPGIACGSELL